MKFKYSFITLSLLSALSFSTAVTAEIVKGIESSTGYAENYVLTGDEMILDLGSVSWNIIKVKTAKELSNALSNAAAGDKIAIAAGHYSGHFKLKASGSKNKPIWVVAEDASDMPTLDGGDYNNGATLAIDGDDNAQGISYIYIQNIKVTNSRGGITVDHANYVTIDGVEAYGVGQAGIHLRDGSKYSIVKNSYIHNTGLYNVKYGEGVYIGSDYTKWPGGRSASEYDPKVDFAQIINNTIGPNVTAEHIDIKEGSSYAFIVGNTFNAAGMKDILNGGLSFIDFKGNYSEVAYNKGDQNGNKYFENAFEINTKSSGWGYHNNIHDNILSFDDQYYNANSKPITMMLALGSKGKPKTVNSTKNKTLNHWVVKNNVDNTNRVSNNTRNPIDKNKMYTGDVTE